MTDPSLTLDMSEVDISTKVISDIEGITSVKVYKSGRIYDVYKRGTESLCMIRFKIGPNEYISINGVVIPIATFFTLTSMNYKEFRPSLCIEIRFVGEKILLYNCSMSLLIRAFSEVNVS